MIPVFVDHRERKYKDPNFAIPKLLTKLSVPIEKKQLDVGDYVILGENLSSCIELKNADDYLNSIKNGRLNDELLNISSNYDRGVLLVYGSPNEALIDTEMRRKVWYNFIAGCTIETSPTGRQGTISVILVETEFDAAEFIKTQHLLISTDSIYREPSAKKTKVPKTKEQLYGLMWLFPPHCHIGKKRAEALLDKFNTIQNVVNASISELECIDGIGSGIATSMVDHLTKSRSDFSGRRSRPLFEE